MFKSTPFEGLYIIEPKIFKDDRGYFFESFNQNNFEELNSSFVQDNESHSSYGTIRGLHFQKGEHAQAKLVRVVSGRILDVVVDLRPNSKTYSQVYTIELSDQNKKQLYIPKGFAHGFSVLSEEARFQYKCDEFYAPQSEGGIRYDDPDLAIDWGIPEDQVNISPKDLELPSLSSIERVTK